MARRRRHRSSGLGAAPEAPRTLQRELEKLRMAIRNGKCNAAITHFAAVSRLAGKIENERTRKALDRMLAKYTNGVKFACTC